MSSGDGKVRKRAQGGGEAAEEDQVRAHTYTLLGRLLARPPDREVLAILKGIEADPKASDPMTYAWAMLRQAVHTAEDGGHDLEAEYNTLFIGVVEGEVTPYASWYRTGSMMERPLVELRSDLARLGYQRQDGVREPEDHAGALCDVMALLIHEGGEAGIEHQQAFFHKHLAPWIEDLFADLQRAESARFYRAVGYMGEQFFHIEKQYLAMRA